ncbi:hypothetical protein IMZ48_18495 [Candidatus Bathyarchaeota archaeon]|nr:hypothetical protein [Candidatus Bathyarchaeota archaeon]
MIAPFELDTIASSPFLPSAITTPPLAQETPRSTQFDGEDPGQWPAHIS